MQPYIALFVIPPPPSQTVIYNCRKHMQSCSRKTFEYPVKNREGRVLCIVFNICRIRNKHLLYNSYVQGICPSAHTAPCQRIVHATVGTIRTFCVMPLLFVLFIYYSIAIYDNLLLCFIFERGEGVAHLALFVSPREK